MFIIIVTIVCTVITTSVNSAFTKVLTVLAVDRTSSIVTTAFRYLVLS